ncbi:PAS domain S-box protein [Thalassotalea ganghwensis]
MTFSPTLKKWLNSIPFKVSVLFGVALLLLTTIISYYQVNQEREHFIDKVMSSEIYHLDKKREFFLNDINLLKNDVLTLKNTPPIQGIIATSSENTTQHQDRFSTLEDWKNRLSVIFSAFLATHHQYTQIRFIGVAEQGREIVRVERQNNKPVIISGQNLQQKGFRDYFQKAITLGNNEFYLSPINLNREFGTIERPFKPTLRGATPVFDNDGQIFGIIIINIDLSLTINSLVENASPNTNIYLLNSEGYYLIHPEPEKTFGFEFNQEITWQRDFPQHLLSPISVESPSKNSDLFSYSDASKNLYLIKRDFRFQNNTTSRTFSLVTEIPMRKLLDDAKQRYQHMIIIIILSALVIGVLVMFFIYRTLLPIRDVTNAINSLTNEEKLHLIPPQRHNELSILAESFNRMAIQINARNNAPIMMHSFDQNGNIIYVNEFWLKTLGYNREQVIGSTWSDFLSDGLNEQWTNTNKEICSNLPLKVTTRDGKTLDVLFSSRLESTSKTKNKRYLAVMIDISHELEIEQALRKSETLFRNVFENARFGLAIIDTNGEWIDANTQLLELLNINRAALFSRLFKSIFKAICWQEFEPHIKQLLAGTSKNFIEEVQLVKINGESVDVLASVALVFDRNNQPDYFIYQFADLTELKLAESKFVQAQKFEAIGSLTGGIAHDFNNMLGIILGNAQLMEPHVKSQQKLEKYTNNIIAASKRGADLTKKLLAFSRKQALSPKTVQVDALIEGMQDMLVRTLGEDVEFSLLLNKDIPSIKVDPDQFELAILNIAINSRDAMPKGGKLSIVVERKDLDQRHHQNDKLADSCCFICISISDTGEGIPNDIKNKVFEPFFTTKEASERSGLGLSMVYGFIKQSNGHINLYSEEHIGTHISLYFPCEFSSLKSNSLPNEATQKNPPIYNDINVLIVEDQEELLEVAKAQIKKIGVNVLSASNGVEAKSILSNTDIDVLFTDMVMPGGIDGGELAAFAKQTQPSISAVLTTGFPKNTQFVEINEPILHKPYTEAQLQEAIITAIRIAQMPKDSTS